MKKPYDRPVTTHFSPLFTGILFFSFSLFPLAFSQAFSYPDQHFVIQSADSLLKDAVEINGITIASDGYSLQLVDSAAFGYVILREQSAANPFNRGLPSWNGTAPDAASAFRIFMRFSYGSGWSPWLTVGFWKNYIWSSYGQPSYADGNVYIDYVKLNSYQSRWQFCIEMKRNSTDIPSPTLHKLSFFVSDSRTDTQINYTDILNDKPAEIFIPTTFLYQYGLDPVIGGSICSPTSVSMILLSYGITVQPVPFARATRDPYHEIFGVWPRVVQNASEYGVDGAVTRYRNWSQAREVLANGGRIAMSVGYPLYSGHLMMLAGFDASGNPIVHDPARSSGYAHKFNKSDLSHSWFDKGGISYTFYLHDSVDTAIEMVRETNIPFAQKTRLILNYPNPFNNSTTIAFRVEQSGPTTLTIYDLSGALVRTLHNGFLSAGNYELVWAGRDQSGQSIASGIYIAVLRTADGQVHNSRLLSMK